MRRICNDSATNYLNDIAIIFGQWCTQFHLAYTEPNLAGSAVVGVPACTAHISLRCFRRRL